MNKTTQYSIFLIVLLQAFRPDAAPCQPADAGFAETQPANLSLKGLADWSIVGGHISSGTGALPIAGAVGERYTDLSTPTAPVEYRSDGSTWQKITGGNDIDLSAYALDASMTAHINDQADPHGATMTVSEVLNIGDGTETDTYIERYATSTAMIASYVLIPPTAATPTATIATGTLWYDSNENKLKVYTGSEWAALH